MNIISLAMLVRRFSGAFMSATQAMYGIFMARVLIALHRNHRNCGLQDQINSGDSPMRIVRHASWTFGAIAAGLVSVTMLHPTAVQAHPATYAFKILGYPDASTVSIALVDSATDHLVDKAQVFALHWAYGVGKGQPPRQVRLPLQPQNDGSFIADAAAGEWLNLVAIVAGRPDPVDGTILVSSGRP
jgi:hypothetical protein